MIPDITTLLKYLPDEALMIIANESLDTSFSPLNATIDSVTELSGVLTTAVVKGLPVADDNPNAIYEGLQAFVYRRLDLTEMFGTDFSISAALPTTVGNLLATITKNVGIVFDANDFAEEKIDALPVQLTPLPQSRRWVGQLNIALIA